jgi:hypothetical protein
MRKVLIGTAAAAAALAATATMPADATGGGSRAAAKAPVYKVVAQGLHNPRQVIFAHGSMYVAEAGSGGTGTCIPGGEGPSCFGRTGSVTRVRDGQQRRILKDLASLGGEGTGESAIGPADLAFTGKHTLVVTFGLGSAPKNRALLPRVGRRQLGHLLAFDLRSKKATSRGDLAAHEARTNPVDNKDSDPTGLARAGRGRWMVTDSGGNTLVGARAGRVKTVAAFQDRMGTSPVTGPDPVPYQSVPTDVVQGPDGAFYVSELTGFPFIEGAARIWRVVPGHKPRVWASGLTNVTSMAFDGRKLYAVQIADTGLINGPVGSLNRVFPDSAGKPAKPIATGFFAPYGVAIHRGAAYVSVGAVAPTGGSVLKIPLG